jgi:hypothetical protein
VDPRLPGGGGNQICGLYDINPAKFGQVNNLVTSADNYGKIRDVYNGVDVTVNARLPRGVTVQGGLSTGREMFDNCDVVGKVDNTAGGVTGFLANNLSGMASPSDRFCHVAPKFLTQVKLLGVYPLPWWGLQTSVTVQSIAGPEIQALYVAPNSAIAPSLGRNLSAGAGGTANVQLIQPGTQYEGRLNQVDFRASKLVRLGWTRMQASVDLYNLLNAAPVLGVNTRFGPSWLRPTAILPARFVKFGLQMEF